MRRTIFATFVLALAAAAAAHAAPCKTPGTKNAKELTFDLKDKNVVAGLRVAFLLGLMPKEFPAKDLKAAACSRGTFAIEGNALELRGETGDPVARWAQPPNGSATLFIALLPKPEPARLWSEKKTGVVAGAFGKDEWMYAVVLAIGEEKRLIFHFFDQIPSDANLKKLLQPIANGKARWQVAFETVKRVTVVNPK